MVEGLGGQPWAGPTRLGFISRDIWGHCVASLRPSSFFSLPQAPPGIHGLLPGSSGLEAAQSPPEGAIGSRTQLALGHSVWPQTAWLPAPAWESPHELCSEECDCGKPNALGQQGWAGMGARGGQAETPAVPSYEAWLFTGPPNPPSPEFFSPAS